MSKKLAIISSYLFFWLFLIFFKLGAGLQYTLLSPLGARVLPIWAVGIVIAVSTLFQLFLDIPAGYLLDKFGYKRMLVIGTLFALAGVLVFFYGVTIPSLIASIFLVAMGWLFFTPGISAYVLSHATRKESVRFMAYRDVFGALGIVLAALSLPFTVNASGGSIATYLGIIVIIALIAILLAPRDKKKITARTSPHEKTHHQRRYLLQTSNRLCAGLPQQARFSSCSTSRLGLSTV